MYCELEDYVQGDASHYNTEKWQKMKTNKKQA